MKVAVIAATAALMSTSVFAKDITLTFTDEEQRGLVQLLDQATRAGGLQAAETAIYFVKKVQAATAPTPPAPPHTVDPPK